MDKNNSNYEQNIESLPKAVLAGLMSGRVDTEAFEHSMEELESLTEACDIEPVCIVTQSLPHPDNATYLGRGKVMELAEIIQEEEAEYCIFEDNLSPSQMRNLQKILGVPVWDRTNLILEIFSQRARTREARLQVESAYLQYMLPRLTGMWQHLGRQGGGSGSRSNKGIGETQLELDRRHISARIAELSRELEVISRTRKVQREGRERGEVPRVALVGYTNAGKSSLMNRLLALSGTENSKQVFEKNMLFATLDTSIRRISRDNNRDFLLSDTVGFIENLPHDLIKAFRSTLEEVSFADLLLIVLDASDPFYKQHRKVTEDTLKDLNAGDIPRIYVMNKADLLEDIDVSCGRVNDNTVYISAYNGDGIDVLLEMITEVIYSGNKLLSLCIPYNAGEVLDRLHRTCDIKSEEYTPEGVRVEVDCPSRMISELERFL